MNAGKFGRLSAMRNRLTLLLALLTLLARAPLSADDRTVLAEITDANRRPNSADIAVIVRRGVERPAEGLIEKAEAATGARFMKDVWTDVYLCNGDNGDVRQVMGLSEDVAEKAEISGWTGDGQVVIDFGPMRPTRKNTPARTWTVLTIGPYGVGSELNEVPKNLTGKPYLGEKIVLGPGYAADKRIIRKSTGATFRNIFALRDGLLVSLDR